MAKKPASNPNAEYTPTVPEKEWTRLSPWEHVRTRTNMYFGSKDIHSQIVLEYSKDGPMAVETTWVPALFVCFREILDNALDEIVAKGFGDRIDVTYNHNNLTFDVRDNGRGIPINFDETEQDYAATILLSHTLTGRNFDDVERGENRGANGIGAKGVNFTSEFFNVEIDRDNKHFEQRFHEGDGQLQVEPPMIFPSAEKKKITGTRITFKPSSKVFHDLRLPEAFIRSRIFEVALCYPQVKIYYNGERIQPKSVEANVFHNYKPIVFEITTDEYNGKFWLVPNFTKDGSEIVHSSVNSIPAFGGGVHIDAFKKGFYSGLLEALTKESKRRKLVPNRADIAEGLLLYNISKVRAPSFDSQSKTRLNNESVASVVRKEMDDPDFYKKVIRGNPEWIEEIYKRCEERTQKKDDSEVAKIAKQNKKLRVEGLVDACGHDRSKCVLAIVEGNSALSGLVESRNAEEHACLALRGKLMNASNCTLKELAQDETIRKLMAAINLVPGTRANRHALRYGKLLITCDADFDGYNISALIINLFFQLWPELFDPLKEPFVYIFETPLIIAVKGKTRKYWYSRDYDKFNAEKWSGYSVTRAKGLGALEKEDWKIILASPQTIPIVDDGDLGEALKLIFSQSPGAADARKAWIGM